MAIFSVFFLIPHAFSGQPSSTTAAKNTILEKAIESQKNLSSDPETVIQLWKDEHALLPLIQKKLRAFESKIVLDGTQKKIQQGFSSALKNTKDPLLQYYLQNQDAFEIINDLSGSLTVQNSSFRIESIKNTPQGKQFYFDQKKERLFKIAKAVCFEEELDEVCGDSGRDPKQVLKTFTNFAKEFKELEMSSEAITTIDDYKSWLRQKIKRGWFLGVIPGEGEVLPAQEEIKTVTDGFMKKLNVIRKPLENQVNPQSSPSEPHKP